MVHDPIDLRRLRSLVGDGNARVGLADDLTHGIGQTQGTRAGAECVCKDSNGKLFVLSQELLDSFYDEVVV